MLRFELKSSIDLRHQLMLRTNYWYRSFDRSSSPRRFQSIYVAMSGGVDSSVAASLLIESGYQTSQIKPIFVRSGWNEDDDGDHPNDHHPTQPSKIKTKCQWRKDWKDLLRVCQQLNINPPQLIDLSKEYWNRVWAPCLELWDKGATPNPDVMCNRHIKFGVLAERLLENDPESLLATGHYARLEHEPRLKLLQARDKRKDQSYYLSTSSPEILRRTLFPIGHLTKTEVRAIAHAKGLVNANKKESMGICFVEPSLRKGRFNEFLAEHLVEKPGQIISKSGQPLGTHRGLWSYTVGQRCPIPSQPVKMFVSQKDLSRNRIIVVPSYDNIDLYSKIVYCKEFHWIQSFTKFSVPGRTLKARLRTGSIDPISCTLKMLDQAGSKIRVELTAPEHGVASSQVLVLQEGEEILGAGTIVATYRDRSHETKELNTHPDQ